MKKIIPIVLIVSTFCLISFGQRRNQNRNRTYTSNTLEAVIIGSGAPQYNVNRAGPSVLIRYKDQSILVDMGNGAQANLNKLGFNYSQLDGIFFTHHHLDHNEEFIPVFVHTLLRGNTFQVVGPKPTKDYVSMLTSVYRKDIVYRLGRRGRSLDSVKGKYSVRELTGGETFRVKDITIKTRPVNHTIDTIAYRFDAGGSSIVISGDLTYSKSLSELSKNADVLIIDSGVVVRKNGRGAGGQNRRNRRVAGGNRAGNRSGRERRRGNRTRAHASLDEVAKMAADANVKTLIMNHLPPVEVDNEATIAKVAKTFRGEVVMAKDLLVVKTKGGQQVAVAEGRREVAFRLVSAAAPCQKSNESSYIPSRSSLALWL